MLVDGVNLTFHLELRRLFRTYYCRNYTLEYYVLRLKKLLSVSCHSLIEISSLSLTAS